MAISRTDDCLVTVVSRGIADQCMAFSWCGGTTEYNVEKSLCCLNDGYALAAKLP